MLQHIYILPQALFTAWPVTIKISTLIERNTKPEGGNDQAKHTKNKYAVQLLHFFSNLYMFANIILKL